MKWEYLTYRKDALAKPLFANEDINNRGEEGWELVAVVTLYQGVYFFFKRRLENL
jgi:hypothetical protein